MEERLQQLVHKKVFWFVLALFTPLATWKKAEVITVSANMLLSVFTLRFAVSSRKEEGGKSRLLLSLLSFLTVLFIMCTGYPASMVMAYVLAVTSAYSYNRRKDYVAYLLAVYVSLMAIMVLMDPDTYWVVPYLLLYGSYSLAVILFLEGILGFRPAVLLHVLLQVGLRVANVFYSRHRFGFLGIMDVFSLPTFFRVAKNYNFQLNTATFLYIVICMVSLVPFLFIRVTHKRWKGRWTVAAFLCSIGLFLGIGEVSYQNWKSVEDRSATYFGGFALSAVEQLKLAMANVDVEQCYAKIDAFPEEQFRDGEIRPHLVTIMSESFADVVGALDLSVSLDPLDAFYGLEKYGCQFGTVHVDTVGGGTSVSEWEYLTGLSAWQYSIFRSPFLVDVKHNYAFTEDPLYDEYWKVIEHPYYKEGWNREEVYRTLEYNEKIFLDEMQVDPGTDNLRKYYKDAKLFEDIEKRIASAKKPLFSMNVTMQNHGGYDMESMGAEPIRIQVEKQDGLDEETVDHLQVYLTLMDHSAKALEELIEYLDAHPEYPTLLVFFGDHYPSDLIMPSDGKRIVYETPYMVYCNYKKIQRLPENLDLSLLFPNVKKAADLPLTSWEQYLLSLDGKLADRDMVIAKIKGKK